MSVEAALAEERERKQIAAGIHDKAGPLLATCYMKLSRAMKLRAPPEVTAALRESRELIDQAVVDLRSLTFDLSSPALYTLGLPAALEELCRDTARHHALTIAFQDQGTPNDLANDQRVVLYRAAHELLLNVVKHAEATRVTVTSGGDAEKVFVSVVDDGVGFDATEAGSGFSRTGGFGLFNLRERLTHLGGCLAMKSSRGTGTCAIASMPVPAPEGKEEREDGNPDSSGG
jgi:signal transduction histidine kinase